MDCHGALRLAVTRMVFFSHPYDCERNEFDQVAKHNRAIEAAVNQSVLQRIFSSSRVQSFDWFVIMHPRYRQRFYNVGPPPPASSSRVQSFDWFVIMHSRHCERPQGARQSRRNNTACGFHKVWTATALCVSQ